MECHQIINLAKQQIKNEVLIMQNRKSFTINVNKDEDEKVEISISNSHDFSTDLEYSDLVARLEDVFSLNRNEDKT